LTIKPHINIFSLNIKQIKTKNRTMDKIQNTIENIFWGDIESLQKINIVNPADFSEPEIVKKIKNGYLLPDSFGLADKREIRLRNELSRFLLENPEIRGKIKEWLALAKKMLNLPNEGNDFLLTYGQENNAYWNMVGDIITELNTTEIPRRLRGLVEKLKIAKAGLESAEREMADRISEKLKNVTKMEGLLDINLFGNNDDQERLILGKKAYSAVWSSGYKIDPPKWTKNFFCKITSIRALALKIKTGIIKAKAYRSAAVLYFPKSLHEDIRKGIQNVLEAPLEKIRQIAKEENKDFMKNKLFLKISRSLKRIKEDDSLVVTIYFRYDQDGLNIRVIGLKKNVENPDFSLSYDNFEGYSNKEKETAAEIEQQINEKVRATYEMFGILPLHEELQKNFGLFNNWIKIQSFSTDSEFKWYAIANLYNAKENVKTYKKLEDQRRELKLTLEQLDKLSRTIELFLAEAERLSLPLCVPEIKDDGQIGVSFNGLAPIDMMGQNKAMTPFDLPMINGRMICLTGRHGGGKSVTGNSVIESIYLAQSGLPVFADRFSLDIKSVLGSVTNDEGDGSTATVFINKVKNLLEEIHRVPKEQSLVFIDEIGKGTQEEAGYRLGKMILSVLQGKENSVIFNTQILSLAEYAQKNLGAICLKVDKNHRFVEGIGDGQMDELIKESGLDKFLSKN